MSRSIDTREQEVVRIEQLIGQARARQMELIAGLDQDQVATADGCRTMTDWVSSRLDVSPETAKVLTNTSRSIADTPDVSDALSSGDLSFDRAAALCRLAVSGGDPSDLGFSYDISGLRRQTARHRRISRSDEQAVSAGRYLMIQPSLDEAQWRMWGQIPGYEGRIVEKALVARADEQPTDPDLNLSRGQKMADSLVSVCEDSLGQQTPDQSSSGGHVDVFVDAESAASTNGEAGVELANGPRIGPEALEAILCQGASVSLTAIREDGTPLSYGRKTRIIPPALRNYILQRDGNACAAEGCTSRYRLQTHHIIPWSEGGTTDPTNLTSLCWFHHQIVVHGHQMTIDTSRGPQRLRFRKRKRSQVPGHRCQRPDN